MTALWWVAASPQVFGEEQYVIVDVVWGHPDAAASAVFQGCRFKGNTPYLPAFCFVTVKAYDKT